MAEWLYEAGIGENRAALVVRGTIRKARIELPGLRAGTIAPARLIDRTTGKVQLPSGDEALCDPLPPGITQGARIAVRIVREPILERGRAKLAKAVPALDAAAGPGPDLLARIAEDGLPVRHCRAHEPDRLEEAGWSEVIEEARTGDIAFASGALRLALTPAMFLFDVDGPPPLGSLSIDAAHAVAAAMERLDIGGSVGIDFPTLANKGERNAVAEAIDAALPQPFERTAMNGFGFLQVVRRRTRMSLPELIAADPAGAALRAELRRLERLTPPAPATYMLPAPLLRRLEREPQWLAELHRRTGGHTRFVEQI
ncbi:ribonuclease [Sphingomonas turrisvirgatae]|uniref:Ribonuclease n=1 Tax=Sphingomonas turrisvirgatae TaxID=1888892 RepID=A0A1E3LXZ5_9SPHN|nr:ribonuclease [Sphingomonas turrisvirgatae]ODP37965.1 ribonuclease [Sphingomonas turrisvirgatae]